MGAQLRVYRRRIRTVKSTKKITKAMELIAASRIVKAQQRVAESTALRRGDHPRGLRRGELLRRRAPADRTVPASEQRPRGPAQAAMLLITSDRGLAGAYSSNAIRRRERLSSLLRDEGKEVVPYVVGRKGAACYRFREPRGRQGVDRLLRAADLRQRQGDRRRGLEAFLHAHRRGWRRRDPHRLHPVRQHGHPAHASRRRMLPLEVSRRPRRSRRRGPLSRCTSSSRRPRRCSTRCCRATSRTASTHALLESAASEHGRASPRHEVRDRQRGSSSSSRSPAGQRGPPGGDHPGDQRDRRWRGRARRPRTRGVSERDDSRSREPETSTDHGRTAGSPASPARSSTWSSAPTPCPRSTTR